VQHVDKVIPDKHKQTKYRPGGSETICPRRWQFNPKIAADLRLSADGSAVRISLVVGGGQAAGIQRVYSLGSCAMGQTDRRITLFQNASLDYFHYHYAQTEMSVFRVRRTGWQATAEYTHTHLTALFPGLLR